MSEYATSQELNGLGCRLNELEKNCAACQADKRARFDNVDLRQTSQNDDIKLLFTKVDEVKTAINKAMGGFAVVVVVIQIVVIIIDKFWK